MSQRKHDPDVWLVTYLTHNNGAMSTIDSIYLTRCITTFNKGVDLYNEVLCIGSEWVKSLGNGYTECVVLTLTKLT